MANSRLLPEDTCWGMWRDPHKFLESSGGMARGGGTSICERTAGHVGRCGPARLDVIDQQGGFWPSKACHVIPTRQGV